MFPLCHHHFLAIPDYPRSSQPNSQVSIIADAQMFSLCRHHFFTIASEIFSTLSIVADAQMFSLCHHHFFTITSKIISTQFPGIYHSRCTSVFSVPSPLLRYPRLASEIFSTQLPADFSSHDSPPLPLASPPSVPQNTSSILPTCRWALIASVHVQYLQTDLDGLM
jgi:hypothetical protein